MACQAAGGGMEPMVGLEIRVTVRDQILVSAMARDPGHDQLFGPD